MAKRAFCWRKPLENPMLILTASLMFAFASAPQAACNASDTACRIRQLEHRVEMLERRLAQQPRQGVEMSVSFTCSDRAECVRKAVQACAEGGFTRGSPIEPQQLYDFFTVQRVTCAG
jgi:hypothetical protein